VRERAPLLAPLLLLLLTACGDSPDYLRHLFPGPVRAAEEVDRLDPIPEALVLLPDGRWAVRAGAPPGRGVLPYRVSGGQLTVSIQGGRFLARVDNLLRGEDGSWRVAVSERAGLLAAATRREPTLAGTAVILVRLADGKTRAVAGWDMSELHGHLDVTAMSISPRGTRLACQLREMHPSRKEGPREVGRRGLVLSLLDPPEEPIDLGPGIRGPMTWSEDGTRLYYVREDGGSAGTLLRIELPEEPSGPVPPEPAPETDVAPVADAESPPPADFTREELVAAIVEASSKDLAVRLSGITKLARMPDPMAVGPLLTALRGDDLASCRAADQALWTILDRDGGEAAPPADRPECRDAAADWENWWKGNPDAVR
jgi:hypothetical protein